MKIKHWQGYGVLDARKTKEKAFNLVVTVSGNHEWGLRRDDMYDLYNWLVKRFDKTVPGTYAEFAKLHPQVFITRWEYEGTEYCQYKFRWIVRD